MRVLIADDHAIVRDGIRWMLTNEPSIDIVGEAGDGASLLRSLPELRPDVVLLDIKMPDMSGIEILTAIKAAHPHLPVLMLTMYDNPELIAAAVERGAQGYLLKSAGRDELIRAIHLVGEGKAFLHGQLTGPLLQHVASDGRPLPRLEAKEIHILLLVAGGHGNRDIAADLDTTEPAVKSALQGIFRKLGANGRSEAVAVAMRLGLID